MCVPTCRLPHCRGALVLCLRALSEPSAGAGCGSVTSQVHVWPTADIATDPQSSPRRWQGAWRCPHPLAVRGEESAPAPGSP